jgi:hypothetical protein
MIDQREGMRSRLPGANHERFESLLPSSRRGDAQLFFDKILRDESKCERRKQKREW